MTPQRLAVYLVVGTAGIYLATWTPAASFYAFFQKTILGLDRGHGAGAILWADARHEPEGKVETAEGDASWGQVLHQGMLLPLPPGRLKGVSRQGETLVLDYEGGVVTADRFPAGFLRGLFLGELEKIGGSPQKHGGVDDAAVFKSVAEATPAQFRVGMRTDERNWYAASLLTKLLLWEGPLAPGGAPGSLALRLFSAPGKHTGALLSWPGTGRAIVVSAEGLFSFGLTGAAADAWGREPARWGCFLEAPPAAAKLWREEVERRQPEGHPLRVWAHQSAE